MLFIHIVLYFFTVTLADPFSDLAKKDPSLTIGNLTLKEGYCTAVLLSPHVILTAAHCVKDMDPSSIQFTLNGNLEAREVGVKFAVSHKYVIHSTYWKSPDGSSGGIDLALVQLRDKN